MSDFSLIKIDSNVLNSLIFQLLNIKKASVIKRKPF